MIKKTYQLTVDGKKELELELEELKPKRAEVSEKIADARDNGDLSENAEYDTAREEQGLLETRIAEIEDILLNAELIETGKSNGKVKVGSTVDLENDKNVTYQLVGPIEANPLEGKISNESPIGQALLGKKAGDKVTIKTPKGEAVYTVKKIY